MRLHRHCRTILFALILVFILLGSEQGRSVGRWVVVIDAGHGGIDPGAIGYGGLQEKVITLEIARLVRFLSLGDSQIEIVLTRWFDETISLSDRIALANRLNAALYVSIHANAHTSSQARGVETLITDPGSSESLRLAHSLQWALTSQLWAAKVLDRGVKRQRLYIRWARMPAALVEVGFLTNPNEALRLQSLWYQMRVAQAILAGIRAHLRSN
jgi:N-acetylmuramoyl-L-alanine amidase